VQVESWAPLAVDAGLERLLGLAEPPTALFAANDSLAFRAVELSRAAGRRVPEDLAVVGFDDIPLAQEMVPPLTTVRIPLSEVGRLAARHLLDQIERDEAPPKTEILPARVIARGTA
jgi:LacI family transcriptional regulator